MRTLFVYFALFAALVCNAGELWISPTGDNKNAGTQAEPLATLRAALERDIKATVRVLPGEYLLDEPVRLTGSNSGASIVAAIPASPPIFSGGRRIGKFTPFRDGLWRATADFRFEQLWVNGRRAERARTPNEGWLFMQGPIAYSVDVATKAPMDFSRRAFRAKAEDFRLLESLTAEELRDVRINGWHSWSVSQQTIARIDPAQKSVFLRGASQWAFFHFGPNQRYQIENAFAALDAPGEWFLARDGWLYYKPRAGEDMRNAEVIAPVLSKLVVMKDAEHITLRGLRFQYSGYALPDGGIPGAQAAAEADAAIQLENSRDIRLENIEVSHTAQYGVWFRRGCRDSLIIDSLLEDLGAGGVRIGETGAADAPNSPTGIVVENNIIREGGRVFPGAVGIFIGHSGGNRIRNNEISGLFYTGISAGWVWGYGKSVSVSNLIEGNLVHHIGFGLLSDMAGIYTLGVSPGTVIRGNVIHDVQSYDQYGRGGFGIYADEGSSDLVIENNLVYRTSSGGFHQHYGRDNNVRNNIFALGKDAQLQRTRAEPHLSFKFIGNIVVTGGTPLLSGLWQDDKVVLDNNVYFDTTGAKLQWGKLSFDQWQASGKDVKSIIADPQFIDIAHDDYQLKKASPALKKGFIPLAAAGPTRDRNLRAQASAVKYAAMKSVPLEPAPPAFELKEDFESQPPGTPPAFAKVIVEGKGDGINVTNEKAHSGHSSLKIQDAPGLMQAYDPYFFYRPNHTRGVTTVRYAIWLEEGANIHHEWRDDKMPYRAGPSLVMQNGSLMVAGKELAKLPTKTWITFEIESGIGAQSTGTWKLAVTLPDGKPIAFTLPYRDMDWRALNWLGFVSNDTKATAAFLDDIEVLNR